MKPDLRVFRYRLGQSSKASDFGSKFPVLCKRICNKVIQRSDYYEYKKTKPIV